MAAQTCSSIPTEPVNTARLVSVKSQPEQDFLNAWIYQELGVLNSIWLDGERFNSTHFVWADGDAMSFINWDDGFPTNQTGDNLCMEMSPKAGLKEVGATEDGKWKDVPCSKRNLVVCEKKPILTVPELRDIVYQLRDDQIQLRDDQNQLRANQIELLANQTQLRADQTQLRADQIQLRDNPGKTN